MNQQEAAALLAVAAAFDNRKPDADAALAWSLALADFDFISARDAVVAHYRESRDWIMPSDIVARIRTIVANRLRLFGTLTPPAEIQGEVDDEQRWRHWAREEVISGRALTPADLGCEDHTGKPKRDMAELGLLPNGDRGGFPQPIARP